MFGLRETILALAFLPAAFSGQGAAKHWAFQPLGRAEIPQAFKGLVKEPNPNPIDLFILAGNNGRRLSPRADRAVLLRRATFDLTGLPPTPEEVRTFLNDKSAEAWPKLIDRLLDSPRYGEQWGRHWMDVVRYADTAGDNADYPVPEARLYRDYIIDAFNADKPYDRFLQEQLAGDILAGEESRGRYAENVIATGFLALSRRYATAPFEFMHLTIEDAIETTGRAFMGMTFRCARCHDHKFDPVTREDYYALYGLFESTRFPYAGSEEFQSKKFPRSGFQPLVPPELSAPLLNAYREQIASIESQLEQCRKEITATNATDSKVKGGDKSEKLKKLESELSDLKRPGAPAALPVAYAVTEGKPIDSRLQPRGEPGDPGPVVPRHAPAFLADGESLNIPAGASGRRQFAQWLTKADHPLTARVMANRLWQYHFGRGLVATPSNFGLRGERPSHPELLDYLAARFVEGGWSIKAVHRLIMTSATYCQQSGEPMESATPDRADVHAAETSLPRQSYASFPRRRLTAEEIRDSMLFVAGKLELQRPGPHPFPPITEWQWTQHNPFKAAYESRHRSVYLMIQRLQRHPYLALFDAPDANVSTDVRPESTVPMQALYLMNNPFVQEQASALARRAMNDAAGETDRLKSACLRVWSRAPRAAEVKQAQRFLSDCRREFQQAGTPPERIELEAWSSYARVLLTSNESFYVD